MADPQEIRVQDEAGNIHVFPGEATPEMIATMMNVKPPTALDLSDPRTVPNARIRNLTVDPTKDVHSAGQALYEGAKTGALVASIPGAVYSTIPQLVGGILGGTAGSAGADKLAKAVGVGDFGQEIASDLGSLAGGAVGAGVTDAAVSAVRQSRLGNALQNVLGLATKDIVARIPVLGHLVRRPSLLDYVEAVKAGAAKPPVYPGAPLPEHPGVFPGAPEPTGTPEQLNPALVSPSRTLPGMNSPEVIRPPASPIPTRPGLQLTGEVAAPPAGSAGTLAASVAQPSTPAGMGIPRTLNGDSVLNQVLGGRDNATLLKIARSRGINVSKESALKPGVGNKLIIGKIIDDFSPEELQEIRDQAVENSRFRHAFGEIGEEAWNTMSLQTYFPDLKIPAATLRRTQTAITAAKSPAAASGASLEDPLTKMLTQVKAGKKLQDLAAQ